MSDLIAELRARSLHAHDTANYFKRNMAALRKSGSVFPEEDERLYLDSIEVLSADRDRLLALTARAADEIERLRARLTVDHARGRDHLDTFGFRWSCRCGRGGYGDDRDAGHATHVAAILGGGA